MKTTDLTVAETILEQLGGNRFRVMTGAKDFVGDTNSLQFRLPRNPKGVTNVRVVLDESDTYTVSFYRLKKSNLQVLAELGTIYIDSLRATFEANTGLRTSL